MKILLVKPPCKPSLTGVNTMIRDQTLFGIYEPLELELVAASVEGENVKILDMRVDPDLETCLEDFMPDLVGVTCWTTGVYWAKKIMSMTKSFDQNITTVIGGHHATLSPSDFHEPYVDIIVVGPGEMVFKALVESLKGDKDFSGIGGLIYQKEKGFVSTGPNQSPSDFSYVPKPKRELTDEYREHYKVYGEPSALIEMSRGCAYKCNFCSIWKSHDGEHFVRDPKSIVDELEELEQEDVFFCDPDTTFYIKEIKQMLDLIEERGIKKKYLINSRVNVIVKHPEIIERWARLGLKYVLIGFESFKEDDLKDYKKKSSIEMNLKALEIIKKNNIISLAQFIVHPDYEKKDFEALERYVIENDIIYPVFTILTPLPGSELYEKKKGVMTSQNYELFDYGHCLLPTKLPRKEFYGHLCKLFMNCHSPLRSMKRLPSFTADLLLNHWKWHNSNITGVKEPWHSDVRSLDFEKIIGNIAMGIKQLPELANGYKDELIDYPPDI